MSGRRFVVAGFVLLLVAVGCTGADEEPVDTAGAETPAPATATTPSPSPTPTPRPEGETLTVTSVEDSGPGTLRQLLVDAQPGDTIVFDAAVFPPDDPQTIAVERVLPQIVTDYLTIDGSDAGIILDGSLLEEHSWDPGLEILSNHNIVHGLQVIGFPGAGIAVAGGRHNIIGGDRSVGTGPVGQGNLTASNDFGIGVWGDQSSDNTVTGNLVGTDVNGAPGLGNRSSGIWISESATDNVIGPDNIIVASSWCGIDVQHTTTLRNTLTRNSIHSSGYQGGICHGVGGNGYLAAPLVTDVDASVGRVAGSACAGCLVEVFSDEEAEGATYEGSATADGNGLFSFDKGGAFDDANVTLTATDAEGSTSEFSIAVGAASDIVTMQRGNSRPRFSVATRPSNELDDNRIGLAINDWVHLSAEAITDFGAKFVTTAWNEEEPPIDWEVSEYDISPELDWVIDELGANGVAIDYTLHFWDKDGEAAALSTPRFKTEEQVEDFVEYVRFIVRHFKGRVSSYTLWSEPDNCGDGGIKCIEREDYIELARQAIPVIRQEDPGAKVAIAPVVLFFDHYQAPAGAYRPRLETFLTSDVVAMFDVIQWHDIAAIPDDPPQGTYYYEYRSIVEDIRETAEAHGFTGDYWVTEMTWCSQQEGEDECVAPDQGWSVLATDKQAAKYNARGIVMHLGMDVAAGVAPQIGATPWTDPAMRRLNTILAGATPTSLDVDISDDATTARLQSYGFRLPGGDTLYAVWTDGPAVDDDPGMNATLTFPGLSARGVVGLDVLHGFEQELITDTDDGDLVIRDLQVKDYPTILQIQP